jgi:hypothetical protein
VQIGIRIFGSVPNTAGPDDQHYTFNTIGEACLQLFQITVGNNWNSVMYPNITATHRYVVSSLACAVVGGLSGVALLRVQPQRLVLCVLLLLLLDDPRYNHHECRHRRVRAV